MGTPSRRTIAQLVKTRLPYLKNRTDLDDDIQIYAEEVMGTLEGFLSDKTEAMCDMGVDIFEEAIYPTNEKSLMADVVAVHLLLQRSTEILGGKADGTRDTAPNFLKSAKAGTVEAEFEQADLRKGAADLRTSSEALIEELIKNAKAKARALCFELPFFDDQPAIEPTATPFIFPNSP